MLRVEKLTAGYGRAAIIRDVGLRAERASVVAVVGPNGSGKSTCLKAIMGLVRVLAGSVQVDGVETTTWETHNLATYGVAYVPQVNNVFSSMSVVENLQVGRSGHARKTRESVDSALSLFPDLSAAAHKQAGQLSGGQRNLLGIARAMTLEPRVLLLDEPTAGLSPRYTEMVWEQVHTIAEREVAIVIVEQNVDLAIANADRVYVLVAGRNVLEGSPARLAGIDLAALFLGGSISTGVVASEVEGDRPALTLNKCHGTTED